jgi:hypothetical protein
MSGYRAGRRDGVCAARRPGRGRRAPASTPRGQFRHRHIAAMGPSGRCQRGKWSPRAGLAPLVPWCTRTRLRGHPGPRWGREASESAGQPRAERTPNPQVGLAARWSLDLPKLTTTTRSFPASCRAPCGRLPTRHVVVEDRPHPARKLVAIAARSSDVRPHWPCPRGARSIDSEGSSTVNSGPEGRPRADRATTDRLKGHGHDGIAAKESP